MIRRFLNERGTHLGTLRNGFRVAFFACAAVVAVLAFYPLDESPFTGHDKANHVLAFAVLAWLADGAFPGSARTLATWALLLLAYGLFIEVVQRFLPYRQFSWHDLGANGMGILLYLSLALLVFAATRLARGRWLRKND
jgi:VanZ family protein